MKVRLLTIAALTLALAVVPAAARSARAATAHTNSGSKRYPDSIGENPNAPDITSMVVSNDNAWNLTFKINISNRPQLTSDMLILCWFNTDENAKTGDTKGAEGPVGGDYAIQLTTGDVGLYQWNGSDYVSGAPQSTLTYDYGSTGATIHINAAQLGGTRGFDFACTVASGITTDPNGNQDFSNAEQDSIPNPGDGTLQYTVKAPVKLTKTGFATSRSPAQAGERLAASLGATENDTDSPVKKGTVECAGRVGSASVVSTHTLANGIVSCFWTVPKSAKGKTFHGTVTVIVAGSSLSKSFSESVR